MIKPLNNYILLQKKDTKINDSGIMLLDNEEDNFAIVLDKSDNCNLNIKISDIVYFLEKNAIKIKHDGKNYVLVKSEDIICVVN